MEGDGRLASPSALVMQDLCAGYDWHLEQISPKRLVLARQREDDIEYLCKGDFSIYWSTDISDALMLLPPGVAAKTTKQRLLNHLSTVTSAERAEMIRNLEEELSHDKKV